MSHTETDRRKPKKKKEKGAIATWLEYSAFLTLRGVVRALPLRLTTTAATAMGRLAFLLLRKHRRRTIQHILFSGVTERAWLAKRIASQSFVGLARTGVESLKLDQFARQIDLANNIVPSYSSGVGNVLEEGRGFILVSAHFGNWELSGLLCSNFEKPLHAVMRPLKNPRLNTWVTEHRKQFGQKVVNKQGALRRLFRTLKNNGNVAMLVDQRANHADGVMTKFFGHPALSHPAPALLHLKTGAPLLVGACRRLPGLFRFEFIARGPFTIKRTGDTAHDVQALTQLYTSELEDIIRSEPSQWLWTARRWEATRKK